MQNTNTNIRLVTLGEATSARRRITQTKAAALLIKMTTGRDMTPIQRQYWDQFTEQVNYQEWAETCYAMHGLHNLV